MIFLPSITSPVVQTKLCADISCAACLSGEFFFLSIGLRSRHTKSLSPKAEPCAVSASADHNVPNSERETAVCRHTAVTSLQRVTVARWAPESPEKRGTWPPKRMLICQGEGGGCMDEHQLSSLCCFWILLKKQQGWPLFFSDLTRLLHVSPSPQGKQMQKAKWSSCGRCQMKTLLQA